jgi:hypothetical protein
MFMRQPSRSGGPIPDSTKSSLSQRLNQRRRERWPQLDSILPSGAFGGTPEEAVDCACGTYLNDPSAWVKD